MQSRVRETRRFSWYWRLCLILVMVLLFCALSACTPEQKTIKLPESQEQELEQEDTDGDFTVKRIYTYEYSTINQIERSAFLEDSGEHQVRILAINDGTVDTSMENTQLECRQVDYRYGFYDRVGNGTFEIKEGWLEYFENTSPFYIDKILVSPTGKQMLLYEINDVWETSFIWLYDFETQRRQLLYETIGYTDMTGAWSKSGRWVAYDVMGKTRETEDGIILFDTQKEAISTKEQEGFQESDEDEIPLWRVELGMETWDVRPPDQILDAISTKIPNIFSAELLDYPLGPGLLTMVPERDSPEVLRAILQYPYEENQWLFQEGYVNWSKGNVLPYLTYELDIENGKFYYLIDFCRLEALNMEDLTSRTILDLADVGDMNWGPLILDFQRLNSGGTLVIQSNGNYDMGINDKLRDELMNSEGNRRWYLLDLQTIFEIDTGGMSLYLYPSEGQEGQLLYKDLYHLIGMEYDEEGRRILLETWDGEYPELGKRRCMILEL